MPLLPKIGNKPGQSDSRSGLSVSLPLAHGMPTYLLKVLGRLVAMFEDAHDGSSHPALRPDHPALW